MGKDQQHHLLLLEKHQVRRTISSVLLHSMNKMEEIHFMIGMKIIFNISSVHLILLTQKKISDITQ